MPKIEHLTAAARLATPWKNGGGVTREVARDAHSQGSSAFKWRVSIAEVSAEGPFSRFEGYHRLIAVIGGRGMELRSPGQALLLEPHRVHAFDGNDEVSGVLPFGQVSDLNLIYRPEAVRASLRFSQRREHWRLMPQQTVIVLNLQDEYQVCLTDGRAVKLAPRDALLATGGGVLELPGEGQCALVEIDEIV